MNDSGGMDLIPVHLALAVRGGHLAGHRAGDRLRQQGVARDGEPLLRAECIEAGILIGAAGGKGLPHITTAIAGVLGVAQPEVLRLTEHLVELFVDLEQAYQTGRGELASQIQQQGVVILRDMAGGLGDLLTAGRGILAQIRQVEQQHLLGTVEHDAAGGVTDGIANPFGIGLTIPAVGQVVVGADPEDHQIVGLEALLLQELGYLVVQVVDHLILGVPGDLVIGHCGGAPFRFISDFQAGKLCVEVLQPNRTVGKAPLIVGRAGGKITTHLAIHLAGVGQAVTKDDDAGEGGTWFGRLGCPGQQAQQADKTGSHHGVSHLLGAGVLR